MKRAHFYLLTFLVVVLFVGISMVSMAEEVVVLKVEISDVVSNADAPTDSAVVRTVGGARRYYV